MAYEPLHHKYRPQRFDQLVGQEAIAATLSRALERDRIAPAYLFSGPRGTGKTSSARILARSLNCLAGAGPTPQPCGACELCRSIASGAALDVIEIDAASNTGVDNIRDLIERSRFAPVQARWKVYVIDECHMLSTAAFNALLKTLEEPPPRVVFVLATTDPQRVLPTILSRCQRFDFRRIPLDDLERHLTWIAAEESIAIQPEALHLVAQLAQGGLRDAESLLDQLSLLPAPVEPQMVWDLLGAVPEQELLQLGEALADADPVALLAAGRTLLDRGREPAAVLQGLAGLLRDLALVAAAPDRPELTSFSPASRGALPNLARRLGPQRLLRWQQGLRGSEAQLRQSAQPRLWLEVLLLGLLAEAAPAPSLTPSLSSPPAAAPIPTASAPAASPPPPPTPAPSPAPSPPPAADLSALWQQMLANLELPSTRMLLSQQAELVRLDAQRAVVRVAPNWLSMVQTRLPLLEQAAERTLGSARQVLLESGQPQVPTQPQAPAPQIPQAPPPAPAPPRPQPQAPPAVSAPVPVTPSSPPPVAQAPQSYTEDRLRSHARRLADFFNGDVVVEPEAEGDGEAA